jgi:hypothetical protein
VVHLLPTSTTDPKLREKREALRQALLTGQTQAPIVNLGQASKKDPMELHLDPQGYQQVGASIVQTYKPGTEKPIGTLVKPDWSKYKFGDLGTLEKIGPGQWRSETGKIITGAPELEVLSSIPKPESFIDKLQRTLPPALGGKGELVSQVFGDKKKDTAKPVTAPPAADTKVQPAADKKSDSFSSKVSNITRQLSDPNVASSITATSPLIMPMMTASEILSNKLSGEKPSKAATVATNKQPAKDSAALAADAEEKIDPAYEPGTPEYDERMEKLQTAAGDKFSQERAARLEKEQQAKASNTDKSANVTSLLQKDQTGLNKAKRDLSDFEKAFAAARAEQGAGGEFTWTDPKTGKRSKFGTLYKGEKPPAKKSVEVDQALTPPANVPVEKRPDIQGSIADRNELADQLEIARSMQQQARRKEERNQDIERVITQLDEPIGTPVPRTAEELASDELWKDIRASAAGKSSGELSAAAKKAMQELEAKITADQTATNTATTKSYQEPTQLPDIELKEPAEPYVSLKDVPIDSAEQTRRQTEKDAADANLKETINTESHAELHDILRLAGRLK